LRRAEARIRELETAGDAAPRDTSFLGSLRDSVLGRREGRGSVPSVQPAGGNAGMSPAWQQTGPPASMPAAPAPAGPAPAPPGGSFPGPGAAAAAGVVGGSLLLGGIRSLMGHPGGAHAAFGPAPSGGASPWGAGAGGELARDAGLDDVGRSSPARSL